MPPILSLILSLYERLKGSGANDQLLGERLRELVHSPFVAWVVARTPNKADDAILAALRALFPPPAPAGAAPAAFPGAEQSLAAMLGR